MTDTELLHTTYSRTHYAGELVSKLFDTATELKTVAHADVKKFKTVLGEALCAANALEQRCAGNPPPKLGD